VKDLTDIELKKASIIDLTDDLELMRKALDLDDFEISEISGYSDAGKMFTLFSLAEYTDNTELSERLDKLFEDELASIYNE